MKPSLRNLLFSLLLLAFAPALPGYAGAQDDSPAQDPPGRVARLNFIQGSVSFEPNGSQDWIQADPNRPLTTGDNLWADENSRAEVHIGASSIRLSSQTGISFLTLDDHTVQIQLAQGTIEVHLRHYVAGDAFEIDTPNIALTLTRKGEYRIQTDPDGNSTALIVREGEGEVTGAGETYTVGPGQIYTFSGTDQLTYDAQPAPAFDDFENWCQSRDDRENHAASAKYVSRDVDGYYDLDDYGDWTPDSDYGNVWYPRVAVDWVPYHFGHWVWIAPWGWTWVEEEPWGFAPFHWGRWAFIHERWGWVPGPIVVRPIYGPAFVGFVGGGGIAASIAVGGFAGVAWFPLGPRDVFIPGFRCSPHYVEVVNVTNTRIMDRTTVINIYHNYTMNHATNINYTYREQPRAVTAVTRETFVNARPVARESVRVDVNQFREARVVENAPLAPTRSSYVSAAARVAPRRPPIDLHERPVVAHLPPRVPVEQRPRTFTNDSREFNQPRPQPAPSPERPGNLQPPNLERNVERNAPPPPRNEERPQPPPRPQPPVRFAPPARAREDQYDVHPPLNQRPPEERREEPRREAPPPKQESRPAPPHKPPK
jgi:hypothetical protein